MAERRDATPTRDRQVVLLLALALVVPRAHAQDPPPRSEVAIREVVLSDGTKRYAVPIAIGRTTLDAGLDTGSPGLRVLDAAITAEDARPTDRRDSIAFGAGAELEGPIADAIVTIGAVTGSVRLQRVDRVDCAPGHADCAAARIAVADYGIQGNGLKGEGFKAILGLSTADANVPSMFAALGIKRWIIELPRPGEGRPGRLVLDPTDDETSGFIALSASSAFATSRGGLHDAVDGCVVNQTSRRSYCGSVLLDTGAPGVTVEATDASGKWASETPAVLSFVRGRTPIAAASFVTDRRDQASRFTLRDDHRSTGGGAGPTVIYAGLLPYFAWSVLYDADRHEIAIRPRPAMKDGPSVVSMP